MRENLESFEALLKISSFSILDRNSENKQKKVIFYWKNKTVKVYRLHPMTHLWKLSGWLQKNKHHCKIMLH